MDRAIHDEWIRQGKKATVNYYKRKLFRKTRKWLKTILTKTHLSFDSLNTKIPEFVFQLLDDHDPLGFFTSIFRKIDDGANKTADEFKRVKEQLNKDIEKSGVFTPENNTKIFKSKGIRYQIKGVANLLYLILNGGNSSNIRNILDRSIPLSSKGELHGLLL